MENAGKAKFHVWSPDEDKLLVQCLVELRTEQKFMADNGFKPGFAKTLEAMMEDRAPGCGIKANPHILSRIKTMKLSWQIVYDMVYGTNTSGFGWDAEKQIVVAEKDVWDEYIKVHKKAAAFRNKCLPHFQELCFVWSKDRAVGDLCNTPGVMEEEIVAEETECPDSPQIDATPDIDLSQVGPDTIAATNNTVGANTEVSSSSRKRRRTSNTDLLVEVLRETVTALDQTIVQVFDNLGNRMSRQAHQAKMEAKAADLYIELMNVEGLTIQELNAAHIKIVEFESLLNAFDKIPAAFKPSWIRSLLGK